MSFTSFEELKKLSDTQINDALILAKKDLFNLRLKKATRQSITPHLFKSTRRKIAQLLTLKSEKILTH
jgi:large subunit ribosomal protein L29